jgi:hypothetical protein
MKTLKQVHNDIRYLQGRSCSFGDTKDEMCSICHISLSENPPTSTLECGHRFHKTCICQWLQRDSANERAVRSCPLCRAVVPMRTIRDLCGAMPREPPRAKRKLTYSDMENPEYRASQGIRPAVRVNWDGGVF